MLLIDDVLMTVGDRDLLEGATLRLEPGEKVGLVGANGCGKSTLLKTIAGIRGNARCRLNTSARPRVESARVSTPQLLESAVLSRHWFQNIHLAPPYAAGRTLAISKLRRGKAVQVDISLTPC